jgi:uncharacterized protein
MMAPEIKIIKYKDKIYRFSNYVKILRNKDEIILYNGKTGNIGVIPLKIWSKILSFSNLKTMIQENIIENTIIDLIKREALVEMSVEEEYKNIKTLIEMNFFNQEFLHLIILPTENCNFRCVYCYEDFKKDKMKKEVIEGIKKLVFRKIKKLSVFTVSWFGGEPLLASDVMEELSNYFMEISNQSGVEYRSNISTNGYLLSPKIFKKCLEWKITHFQITLDGPPDVHDKRRKLISGGGTFSKIFENLKNIKNLDLDTFKMVIRINIDKTTIEKLPLLFDIFENEIGKDNRFYFYFRNVFYPDRCKKLQNEFIPFNKEEEKEILWKLFNEIINRGLNFYWDSFNLKPFSRVCYAALPCSLVIGADGKIYKCTVQFNTPLNQVGYILPNGEINLDKYKFLKWCYPYYEEYEKCKNCFLLLACQGRSCPANGMKNFYCEFDEGYFDEYLKVYVDRGPGKTNLKRR